MSLVVPGKANELILALRGGVARYNLATQSFTSCAFVGESLDHLLITTARENMTKEDITKFPQSGNIFIVQPGVKGVPDHRCAL